MVVPEAGEGSRAAGYPVMEIGDSQPVAFPGLDQLILNYAQLQAVMREHRYGAWRTALAWVVGIYLITDTREGRHDVDQSDGAENVRQRWSAYAANGHGGNVSNRPSSAPLDQPRTALDGQRCVGVSHLVAPPLVRRPVI